jgi:hypothetical protein
MKYSNLLGVIAAILLIAACFLPWTYYPNLGKSFTGFFTEDNYYGKPGKVFVFFAVIAIVLFIVPRIWAKRFNMLVTVLTFAFGIKTYFLFSGCYMGICPDKKTGLFLILITPVVMMIAAILPDLKLKDSEP